MPGGMNLLSDIDLVQCCVLLPVPVQKGDMDRKKFLMEWEKYLTETWSQMSRLAKLLRLSAADLAKLKVSEQEMLRYADRVFQDAWSEMYRRYKGLVCSVVMKTGFRGDDVEDILQEVFGLKLPEALKNFDPTKKLSRLVAEVAHNASIDEWRRRNTRRRRRVEVAFEEDQHGGDHPDQFGSGIPSPHEAWVKAEKKELIAESLNRLEVEKKNCLFLCGVLGFESEEAARIVGKSAEAVRQSVCRAKNKLRKDKDLRREYKDLDI